jgi:hypothetical protein
MVRGTTGQKSAPHSFLTVVRLTTFERTAHGLLSDADHASLDELLAARPEAGPVIRGTGGVRKLRLRLGSRGKSGGVRIIYYHHPAKQRVYLILAYAKNAKDSLSGSEKQQMRKLTAVLETEP